MLPIQLIFILLILGVIFFLVDRFLPMDATIKTILRVAVLLCLGWWLLTIFGLLAIGLIKVVAILITCGVLLWLAETVFPMSEVFRYVIRAVVVLALVAWLLSFFGLLSLPARLR